MGERVERERGERHEDKDRQSIHRRIEKKMSLASHRRTPRNQATPRERERERETM